METNRVRIIHCRLIISRAEHIMSLPKLPHWLRRPLVAACLLVAGLIAAAPAQAQYYPSYGYYPQYAGYCDPYYYPYGCPAGYAGAYSGYGYPYAAYAPAAALGLAYAYSGHRWGGGWGRHRHWGGGWHRSGWNGGGGHRSGGWNRGGGGWHRNR
jgi:uncharacterized membrane protein YgcG